MFNQNTIISSNGNLSIDSDQGNLTIRTDGKLQVGGIVENNITLSANKIKISHNIKAYNRLSIFCNKLTCNNNAAIEGKQVDIQIAQLRL